MKLQARLAQEGKRPKDVQEIVLVEAGAVVVAI
jgi:hypothetical protein